MGENSTAVSDQSPNNEYDSPSPDNFVGDWKDETFTFDMSITYEDGAYWIDITQNISEREWKNWSLEGYYEQDAGIFYSGGCAELYLRDDGTVGGGGAGYDWLEIF